MTEDRRGDDDRIADIQRVCHEVQKSQVQMMRDHLTLATRVSVMENWRVSHEREVLDKLNGIHETHEKFQAIFAAHTAQETKNLRAVAFWLASLVASIVTGIGVFLVNRGVA